MSEPMSELPQEAYSTMALVLRVGLALALAVLLGALATYLARYTSITPDQLIQNNPIEGYISPQGLVNGLLGLHSEAFMTLGILVLAVTPIARVFTGLWYFRKAGDRPLAWVAFTVLMLLLIGFFIIGPVVR